ncbi:MAG: hypothetical protein PVF54_07895 [Anaerolineae bacterium]|jgi:hypothetical protein
MVEDLREQMLQEDEFDLEEEDQGIAQMFLSLRPWQRLVLALLLLFDVALCGLMALVMTGRVVPPF